MCEHSWPGSGCPDCRAARARHPEDQGEAFGKWPDPTAQLMYSDIMPLALSGVDTSGIVADYGGANGLLKQWIPNAISVDYDPSKKPDVEADILQHRGDYDLIVMRYVLHYLPNESARKLFRHLASFHNGRILIIQFVNDDLAAKERNSVGEVKYFRDELETTGLFIGDWVGLSYKAVDYMVGADFYRWRLNHPNPTPHYERVCIWELKRAGD